MGAVRKFNEITGLGTGGVHRKFNEIAVPSGATYRKFTTISTTDVRSKTITSDAEIAGGNQKTLLSNAHIKLLSIKQTILSDTRIIDRSQQNITSNAFINIQQNILSDVIIKVENIQQNINSDANILIIDEQKIILSDAFITLTQSKTIESNATVFLAGVQKNLLSDALITPTVSKTILSDAQIKSENIQQTILSDSKIVDRLQSEINSDAQVKVENNSQHIYSNVLIKGEDVQQNILSNSRIQIREQENILSDAYIFGDDTVESILSDANIVVRVLSNINNKFNSVKQVLSDINNKFTAAKLVLSDIHNFVNIVKGKMNDVINDFRTKKLEKYDINNDIRFIKSWQVPGVGGAQSLGKTYIRVYINSVEVTDIDVDSIQITEILNAAHTATFDLGRPYDASKPAMESLVEIKYHVWNLYRGYISEINPSASPESITIRCQDKYWLDNRTNKYFHVGHKPTDNKEKYYSTINEAISTEFGWNLGMGNFVPQTIDAFGQSQADVLTSLLTECGNYGWFYDVDFSRKLWTAGEGSIINIERQEIGKNIGLYQLIEHQFNENVIAIKNKSRVQMGEKVIRKFNLKGGSRTYTGYSYAHYEDFVIPAWDSSLEKEGGTSSDGFGWDYPEPGLEKEYGEVYKKYRIPFLNTELSSYTDRYPPKLYVHSPGGYYFRYLGQITEGFSIDFENRILLLNDPIKLWRINREGHIVEYRSPPIKLELWKKEYYTFTKTPSDNPEEDISNPLMFFTDKMGSYPTTVMNDLNLSTLSVQVGYTFIDPDGVTHVEPSWDDTEFAKDYANWRLSKTCDKKIQGTIILTLDAKCFYSIDLTKRIFITGVTETPMNIISISYNIGSFTVTLELENSRGYRRSVNLQTRGE